MLRRAVGHRRDVSRPTRSSTARARRLTASATVSDVAGNSTTATSAPVKIDQTAPSTTASSVPDWSNTERHADAVGDRHALGRRGDALHGRRRLDPDRRRRSSSRPKACTRSTFWSIDHAGNVETAHTATVKIDLTAPSITVTQSPAANGAGWNNTDVTVTFTCGDCAVGYRVVHVAADGHEPRAPARASPGPRSTTRATRRRRRRRSTSTRPPPTIVGVVPRRERQRLVQRAGHGRRGRAPTRCRALRRARLADDAVDRRRVAVGRGYGRGRRGQHAERDGERYQHRPDAARRSRRRLRRRRPAGTRDRSRSTGRATTTCRVSRRARLTRSSRPRASRPSRRRSPTRPATRRRPTSRSVSTRRRRRSSGRRRRRRTATAGTTPT